jgi:hypothetical protein
MVQQHRAGRVWLPARPITAQSLMKFARQKYRGRLFAARILFGMGGLPNTLIIGAQKGGTTSLFEYLAQHPNVCPCSSKEPQYFDTYFDKGPGWYKAWFHPKSNDAITFEASPHVLFHPLAPERVFALIPNAKLIVLLRNPVDRAYSHYQHWIELGYETLSFEEALKAEKGRTDKLWQQLKEREPIDWLPLRNYSYVRHGLYAEQIDRWLRLFQRKQLLFLKSEEMYASPSVIMERVLRFLEIEPVPLRNPKPYNQRRYPAMSPQARSLLESVFEQPNAVLKNLTGIHW